MKKHRMAMTRFVSALLVLTLASSCALSGTLAKYVTTSTSDVVARVAKYGIEVTISGDLFHDTVTLEDGTTYTKTITIEPGATGGTLTIELSGVSEVAYQIEATVSNMECFYIKQLGRQSASCRYVGYLEEVDTTGFVVGETPVSKYYVDGSLYGVSTWDGRYVSPYKCFGTNYYQEGVVYYQLVPLGWVGYTTDECPVIWYLTGGDDVFTVYWPSTTVYYVRSRDSISEFKKFLSETFVSYLNANSGDAGTELSKTYQLTWKWQDWGDGVTDLSDTQKNWIKESWSAMMQYVEEHSDALLVCYDKNSAGAGTINALDYNFTCSFDLNINITQVD